MSRAKWSSDQNQSSWKQQQQKKPRSTCEVKTQA